MVTRWAHNPKIDGSIPSLATKVGQRTGYLNLWVKSQTSY